METTMFKLVIAGLLAIALCQPAPGMAAEHPQTAVAMVKKAVACLKANGKDKTIAEANNRAGASVDRDLYVAITDMTGKALANPMLPRSIGKDLTGVRDVDGKYFVKERLEMLKTKSQGWIDDKWPNPVSKKIELRSTYFERVDELVIACGIYKSARTDHA
jgi:cytochrome c